MFDIGWQEIFLIAVVALIIIGPQDLPRTLKTVTGLLRKVKGMARDFQGGLDDIVRETELADMRKQIEAETGGDLMKSIENSIDPTGEITKDLDELKNAEGDLTKAVKRETAVPDKDDDSKANLPDPNEAMTFDPPEPDPKPEPAAATETASADAPTPDKKD